MNIFYEEDGGFKVGSILTDNTTSLQVENTHGKRSKIKSANVMLRFAQPGLSEFMAQAEQVAAGIDVEFLWEASPPEEFNFDVLAQEYFGHAPTPIEAAGALIRLHSSPMHFYKKGKGRYKAAPPDALKSALASAEKKRLQAELQARYTEQLSTFQLPAEFTDKLSMVLYQPDRNTLEVKALEAACAATHLSAAHLLHQCGALPSTHDYHLNKFLFENFPRGTGFPEVTVDEHPELPLAPVTAFSIDDASTTEIDDAFSLEKLPNGNWRIGIHIAAPALCIAPNTPIDAIAAQRMSTVYMPGDKITMLPDNVVQSFTLCADKVCPSLSLYVEADAETLAVLNSESRIERLHIAANLRHDTLEPLFNEATLAAGKLDYAYAPELKLLWDFANKLEAARGNARRETNSLHDGTPPQVTGRARALRKSGRRPYFLGGHWDSALSRRVAWRRSGVVRRRSRNRPPRARDHLHRRALGQRDAVAARLGLVERDDVAALQVEERARSARCGASPASPAPRAPPGRSPCTAAGPCPRAARTRCGTASPAEARPTPRPSARAPGSSSSATPCAAPRPCAIASASARHAPAPLGVAPVALLEQRRAGAAEQARRAHRVALRHQRVAHLQAAPATCRAAPAR